MPSKLDRHSVPVVMRSRTTTTTTHYADGRTVTRRTSVKETMQGSQQMTAAERRSLSPTRSRSKVAYADERY